MTYQPNEQGMIPEEIPEERGLSRYMKIRSQIKSGDVITWEGKGAVSWLIRRWSKRSHASMCLKLKDDRRYILEAWEGEFNMRLLSDRLKNYQGKAFWHQLNSELNQYRRSIEYSALSLLGVKYDYNSLFANMLGRVSTNAKKLFCSEAICHIFLRSIPLNFLKGYRSNKYACMMIDGIALRPGGIAQLPLYLSEKEITGDIIS